MDYKTSGVNIDAGNEVVRRVKTLARSTFTPRTQQVRAIRLMAKTMVWLASWREVCRLYRANSSPPPLSFRSGLIRAAHGET